MSLYCIMSIITASVPVEISQGVSIQLQQSQVSYFQFEVPVEGVSITLSGSQGRMVLYGSYNSPNPSSALHEYSLENSGDIYIEPSASVIQKRQILQSNATLYASVEGLEAYNDFVMWSTKGDITISKKEICINDVNIINRNVVPIIPILTYTFTS